MNDYKKTHISIGSNIGDKLKNLEKAIELIHLKIAVIESISSIYKTEAIGFKGEDFLNICISIFSNEIPSYIMQNLLDIEKILGRVRNKTNKPESRIIDIDIIFIEEIVINSSLLQVPHPKMQNRKFVLKPLLEIDPKINHPITKESIPEMLRNCKDTSQVKKTNLKVFNPKNNLKISKYKYIAIEGNIGAGKTSLAKKIAVDFNSKLIIERFADNPFLPKFYKDPERYAFTLEMSFLSERYQQISEDLSQLNIFNELIISDYDIHKSLIFSKVNLSVEEFSLYRKLFYDMYKKILKPDLFVFLNQDIPRLQKNISRRGRDYENRISNEYLSKINSGYFEFFRSRPDLNIKIIDITNLNFVENRLDYLSILDEITS
ncbi:MAG: 2-amino-4-hydroxy-6-hydroxymethyldihydropteridine diphosphokinase [Flavobacteriaceae bacterium]|jgi:deoxyguanosine kinase|nr:2-amino-4-hydroxy-6-hydroxymethyldihydropteridine diphosphokinase [Flavobacteriaceae bacterium]MBT4113077.1 2-amino-4-hydroxy-6-hydroxymethyldihydropteridine diphosphokinase [Flavobacteriaceae bacterium]MBT4613932.1 2-amino-4-hydroxy-6-hydroxymethyldihydropteridine diphosphokinase [Flavobacteriaceae bacterium]MBT5246106.1 2-amino-4-hydroxy-6-hydroxymethyldihydropteridine diphosphokinase [Flavobacteriaceae bacterium]MBT5650627.1 2-amino-4-hydroxy-6-hydroxymethyldihydropteridine diphosphokinas